MKCHWYDRKSHIRQKSWSPVFFWGHPVLFYSDLNELILFSKTGHQTKYNEEDVKSSIISSIYWLEWGICVEIELKSNESVVSISLNISKPSEIYFNPPGYTINPEFACISLDEEELQQINVFNTYIFVIKWN